MATEEYITVTHGSYHFLTLFFFLYPAVLLFELFLSFVGVDNIFGMFEKILMYFSHGIGRNVSLFGDDSASFIPWWFLFFSGIFVDVLIR